MVAGGQRLAEKVQSIGYHRAETQDNAGHGQAAAVVNLHAITPHIRVSQQVGDPAFVKELRQWVRFNPEQAVTTGDGLYSGCTGHPAMPSWIGERAFGLAFTKDGENATLTKQIRSSAGIAVFTGDKEDKDHWVRVGRSFQRFALMATALGLRHALINQPVESPLVRAEFSRWLGIGAARPDLCVRFGHGPTMPMSMRRPVADVVRAA